MPILSPLNRQEGADRSIAATSPMRIMAGADTWAFAVIGAATGAALMQYGIHADLCPDCFTSEALAVELTAAAKREEPILLLRSETASPVLPEMLRKAGFAVKDIPIYSLQV